MWDDLHPRRGWSVSGACLVAALGMAATSTPLALADDLSSGRIAAITDAHLILSVESVDFTYRWNEETAVMLDGESAEVTDLQAGDNASVVYQRAEDGVLLAISVDAVRR